MKHLLGARRVVIPTIAAFGPLLGCRVEPASLSSVVKSVSISAQGGETGLESLASSGSKTSFSSTSELLNLAR